MRCPSCGYNESKVTDSRPTEDNASVRRRRECLSCLKRFTTYEIVENMPIIVIKKDKRRESFDRSKILRGIWKACDKRHVSEDKITTAVLEVELHLQNCLEREVESHKIGEMVMEKLRSIDEVAYVRFASVYREF